MKYFEKLTIAMNESRKKKVLDKKTGKEYEYGENPYYNMVIENCIFCDMFSDEVKDQNNFYGFNREHYAIA